MAGPTDTARIAMQVSRGVVVASIQVDLDDEVLHQFQRDLLDRIHASRARGVILELSGADTLDPTEFGALRRIASMASMMGARAVFVGLRPGVVSALVETDTDVQGVLATLDLDDAFLLLERDGEAIDEPAEHPDAETEATQGLDQEAGPTV